MKIIAIESSGLVASVAVVEDEVLLGEYTINNKMTHSTTLLPMLDTLLSRLGIELSDADYLAVSEGPGSFTGLRIGSATAKGIGMASGLKIIGVPTTVSLAFNVWGGRALVCPLMDARRNQTYTGIYAFEGGKRFRIFEEQCAVGIEEIIYKVNRLGRATSFLGDGVPVFKETIESLCKVPYDLAPAHLNRQRAASLAVAAFSFIGTEHDNTYDMHRPDYLRVSQAERERAEREKAERERAEREKAEREKAEREKTGREAEKDPGQAPAASDS